MSGPFEFSVHDLFLISPSVILKTNAYTFFSSIITGENVKYPLLQFISLNTFISAFRLILNHWVWPFRQFCAEEELWHEHIFSAYLMTVSPRQDLRQFQEVVIDFLTWLFRHTPILWKMIHMAWQGLYLIKLCWLSFANLVSFVSNFFPGRFCSVFMLVCKLSRLINGRLLFFLICSSHSISV